MNYKKTIMHKIFNTKAFRLFGKAISSTSHEMLVSLEVLFALTVLLSVLMYLSETIGGTENYSFWKALEWSFLKYIGDPADISPEAPQTQLGIVFGNIIGIIGIAIFAVPAGIIGSAFTDVMNEDKREREIEGFRDELSLSFKRTVDVTFRQYINQMPEESAMKGYGSYFVPAFLPIAKIQLRCGMDLKDCLETSAKYPEFRVTNLAQTYSPEENPEDRFVITHQPINRSYGYFIDRKSKVTIVSTSSVLEAGTGYSAYDIARFGGFNYISKDVEVSLNDLDSYLNMAEEPKVMGKSRKELLCNKRENKNLLETLNEKEANRLQFIEDLSSLCRGEDSWLFCILGALKNTKNTFDFHLVHTKDGNKESTVLENNYETFDCFCKQFSDNMSEEFGFSTSYDAEHPRYPHTKNFLAYRMKQIKPELKFNTVKMYIACHPVMFDNRFHVVNMQVANLIGKAFGGSGMTAEDIKQSHKQGFGW